MSRQPFGYDTRFVDQPGIIDPGAAPDPIFCFSAETRRRQSHSRSGIPDTHLAYNQSIRGGIHRIVVMLAVVLAAYAMGWLARAKLSGQPGGVLGATQQIAEVAALTVLVALT